MRIFAFSIFMINFLGIWLDLFEFPIYIFGLVVVHETLRSSKLYMLHRLMYKYVLRPFITFSWMWIEISFIGFLCSQKIYETFEHAQNSQPRNEFFGTVSHSNFYNHSTESFKHASKLLVYDQPNNFQLHLETCWSFSSNL